MKDHASSRATGSLRSPLPERGFVKSTMMFADVTEQAIGAGQCGNFW
jgi:hypothetical protein